MTGSHEELRDSLLDTETWDRLHRERYEHDLKELLEGRLGGARKWLIAAGAAPLCLATAIISILLVTRVENLGAKAGLILVALYGLVCAGVLVTSVFRGSLGGGYLRFTGTFTSAGVLLFALAALWTSYLAPDRTSSIQVVCVTLLGLVPAALGAVLLRIRDAERVFLLNSLRVESKLLELKRLVLRDDRTH